MSAAKKQIIDDEGRISNNEWCSRYLVVQHKQGVVCLVCQNTIAVMKEYNVKRHYTSTPPRLMKFSVDKIEHLKRSI